MDTDTEYCRALVEAQDRDRYILTLAAPAAARPALWALYAFNHELAKTREVTRDPQAGQVRLAWWRNQITSFYAGAPMPAHDVARPLGQAIRAHALPQENLMRLIDARGFDLDGGAPASLDGLGAYADATNTPLNVMAARILQVEMPGSDLGQAYGLTGLVRALPFLAQRNHCLLPLEMLDTLRLMPEQFHHLAPSPALAQAVAAIAARAQAHLDRAQTPHRLFMAEKRLIRLYLRRIAQARYDPFDPLVSAPVPFLAFRVLL